MRYLKQLNFKLIKEKKLNDILNKEIKESYKIEKLNLFELFDLLFCLDNLADNDKKYLKIIFLNYFNKKEEILLPSYHLKMLFYMVKFELHDKFNIKDILQLINLDELIIEEKFELFQILVKSGLKDENLLKKIFNLDLLGKEDKNRILYLMKLIPCYIKLDNKEHFDLSTLIGDMKDIKKIDDKIVLKEFGYLRQLDIYQGFGNEIKLIVNFF